MHYTNNSHTHVTPLRPNPLVQDDKALLSCDENSLQVNKELQTKADRLTHLLQVMPAGVIVLDQNGVIKQANHQAVALLGEPLEKALWREVIVRSFKPQADDGHEVSLRDGRKVKLSITPLVEEKGQLIVITDLTETRDLQSRISHLQKLSSLGKMVATLAHQVRTPLSSALLYASNLRSLKLNNPTADKFTSKLLTRLKDLESQVNDMLLFAKSGDQQIVKPINIADVVNTCVQTADAQAFHRNIVLNCCTDLSANSSTHSSTNKSVEPVVLGNETALCGAISNLLHNAIQASPSDTEVNIVVSIENRASSPMVQIAIADQGCGIDETKTMQMFEPFYTSKSQGTGLGLAVVKSVAQSHKGEVTAHNNSNGVGACFNLLLPTFIPQQDQASPYAKRGSDNSTETRGYFKSLKPLSKGVMQ